MLMEEVLIIKFLPVNGPAPCSILVGDISSLDHKFRDDTVEYAVLIPELIVFLVFSFTCAKTPEILCCLGHIGEQFELNPAEYLHFFLFIVLVLDLHKDLIVDF